jgi:hypothetical protein
MTRRQQFLGAWRIVETEVWAQDALNLVAPAQLAVDANGLGRLEFIAIQADIDYRLTTRDGLDALEFTWQGLDDGDECSGRGWAVLEHDRLHGRLFIHRGDDSSFTAVRPKSIPVPLGTRRSKPERSSGR